MKKPKKGDRCVGVITSAHWNGTYWVFDVAGTVDPEFPQLENYAYSVNPDPKSFTLNQICWFEFKPWPTLPKYTHWQLVTENEIEINRQD
jgi:hypothetical protein